MIGGGAPRREGTLSLSFRAGFGAWVAAAFFWIPTSATAEQFAVLRPPADSIPSPTETEPRVAFAHVDEPVSRAVPAREFAPGSAGPSAMTAQGETAGGLTFDVPAPEPGWFGAVTLGVVRPHMSGRLGVAGDGVGLPVAELPWTAAPRVEFGYRLSDGAGNLRLGYQFLTTSGNRQDAVGGVHSRVEVNAVNIDYVSREWLSEVPTDLIRDLRVTCGMRLATARLTTCWSTPDSFERFDSRFTGAGPRLGLEWRSQRFAEWPLELYARAEGTGLVGQTSQTTSLAPSGLRQWGGTSAVSGEVGVGWQPMTSNGLKFIFGYQFDRWWDLGRTDIANAELTVHGIFIRCEWRY